MKKIYLIGVGPGNPDYLTVKAINTMKKVDVFFFLKKKEEREDKDLIKIRREILEKYLNRGTYRIVTANIPERKKGESYEEKVKTWRQQKAEIITDLIKGKMNDGESGALLVWGDPSLYDGNLEILQNILKRGAVNFEYETVAGITSVQVLAERHKIPLNRIGETITITTGRRLKKCSPSEVINTVVLLDSYSAFRHFKDTGIDIYWGGYLGTDDEILLSGKLKDIIEDLKKTKKEAKKKKGWLMDTYILRQPEGSESNE
ncbi:precorrin-6A synthase (deacetylating) [Thermodesulfovibrionales bacterium]|nr:precorrin-6A synthase (deacetylating) [Thermodesulfovibrionales bacterium]